MKTTTGTSRLATWLFIAPIFLQRAFIGGEGDSYADYPGFSLQLVGYFCHFSLIILAAFRFSSRKSIDARIPFAIISLAILSIFQLGYSSEITGIETIELLLPLGRGWLWLIAILLFAGVFFEELLFCEVFFTACKIGCLISIVCLIFYLITGIAFGVHIARDYPRVQGFFSEPSALAVAFPALLIYSILNKERGISLLAFTGIAASGSVIVFLTVLFSAPIILLKRKRYIKLTAAALGLYSIVVAFSAILINSENAAAISQFSQKASESFGIENEESAIYEIFFGRIFSALSALSEIISTYSPDNIGGGLARLIGTVVTLDQLKSGNMELFGFGLNVYGYVTVLKYGDIFDFGFFPFMLSSFGIVIGILSIFILGRQVHREMNNSSGFGIILTVGFFATLTNSAGGLHAYSIPMLGLVLALFTFKNRAFQTSQVSKPRFQSA